MNPPTNKTKEECENCENGKALAFCTICGRGLTPKEPIEKWEELRNKFIDEFTSTRQFENPLIKYPSPVKISTWWLNKISSLLEQQRAEIAEEVEKEIPEKPTVKEHMSESYYMTARENEAKREAFNTCLKIIREMK